MEPIYYLKDFTKVQQTEFIKINRAAKYTRSNHGKCQKMNQSKFRVLSSALNFSDIYEEESY